MLIPRAMTKQHELMVGAGKGPGVRTPEPAAQDAFLDQMIKDRCTVLVYLKSGIRLTGALDSFDTFVITLRDGLIVDDRTQEPIRTGDRGTGTGAQPRDGVVA